MKIEDALFDIHKICHANGMQIDKITLNHDKWDEMADFVKQSLCSDVFDIDAIEKGMPFKFLGMEVEEILSINKTGAYNMPCGKKKPMKGGKKK